MQDKKKELEFFDNFMLEHPDYDLWGKNTYDFILDFAGLKTKDRHLKILDLGCGTGVWSEKLAAVGHTVVGVDISLKMLEAAAKKKTPTKDFSLVAGDIESLPFKKGTFDLCFVGGVLHHFPSVEKALEEAKKAVAPDGRLLMIEPNGSNPIMRLSYLLRLLLDPYIHSSGRHASPNEQTYPMDFYEKWCRRYWSRLCLIPLRVRMSRDPSHRGWFLAAIVIRQFIMDVVWKVLPSKYGCNMIIIVGE